jgi:hypothetical protein
MTLTLDEPDEEYNLTYHHTSTREQDRRAQAAKKNMTRVKARRTMS